jgi:hypothetical protein
MGCKDDRKSLPILADFLDEKFNLPATAEMFRAPDLQKVPGEVDPAGELHYCRLERDVFLWLLLTSYNPPRKWDPKPGVVVGLYAHPEGLRERWAKIAGLLPLKESDQPDPEHPWRKVPEPEPRFEQALEELSAFTSRPR